MGKSKKKIVFSSRFPVIGFAGIREKPRQSPVDLPQADESGAEMICWNTSRISRRKIMERKAGAVWKGGLKDGHGIVTTASGVLKATPYSFSTRFENGQGTNPEELIAAAHAGCFSMALSAQLGNAGITPESISTEATLTLEKLEAGFTITKIHLDVTAKIPGGDPAAFETAAQNAKSGCPVSKVLKAEITMNAKLI
jgi:osmotically inducible protein OsmC